MGGVFDADGGGVSMYISQTGANNRRLSESRYSGQTSIVFILEAVIGFGKRSKWGF
jgi:hypothetical protein